MLANKEAIKPKMISHVLISVAKYLVLSGIIFRERERESERAFRYSNKKSLYIYIYIYEDH